MSDLVLVALIMAIPPTLASLASVVMAWKTGKKVEEVHKATNGMKDALIASATREGHAAGVLSEHARNSNGP